MYSPVAWRKPKDWEEFLLLLAEEGYEIKRGKNIAIKGRAQQRFVRLRSLGEDYTEEALKEKTAKKIILSRPAVEAGEKLGFLPGDMKDKIDPYLQPLYDALEDMLPAVKLQDMIEKRVIQIAPLAFMRGRTLSDAVVILDEAQNTTTAQIRMFLTRMGWNTKMIITGDLTQVDLPHGVTSGLREAVNILKNVEGISIIRMDEKDIVRHKLVTRIVKAYNEADKAKQITIQ